MTQATRQKVAGNIFINGKMQEGTLTLGNKCEFSDGIDRNAETGTVIPSFINGHTHIGDSFITQEPYGGIAEVVGPGGFKHRMLENARREEVVEGIRKSVKTMETTGTTSFIDFRESGLSGLELIYGVRSERVAPIVLGRPRNDQEINEVLRIADGVGMSSISDHDFGFLLNVRRAARTSGKIFSIHFSENHREDIDLLKELSPDLIVHALETTQHDLNEIREIGCPVAITPHSNIFYGKRPDYSKFIRAGIEIMLGTDNCMVTAPDMFSEMELLYYFQRGISRISPEQIIASATESPRKFLKAHLHDPEPRYIFFPGVLLTPYEIVTRGRYYSWQLI
ncbi:MAG: amidohydrolase family protein [Thermoplasmataceae archaeon]